MDPPSELGTAGEPGPTSALQEVTLKWLVQGCRRVKADFHFSSCQRLWLEHHNRGHLLLGAQRSYNGFCPFAQSRPMLLALQRASIIMGASVSIPSSLHLIPSLSLSSSMAWGVGAQRLGVSGLTRHTFGPRSGFLATPASAMCGYTASDMTRVGRPRGSQPRQHTTLVRRCCWHFAIQNVSRS